MSIHERARPTLIRSLATLAVAAIVAVPAGLSGQVSPPQDPVTPQAQATPTQTVPPPQTTPPVPPQTPAQTAPATPQVPQQAAAVQGQSNFEKIIVAAGRSVVLSTQFDIKKFAITNPDIADATVVSARQMVIDGKSAGTVSLIIWGDSSFVQYDVEVDPGITTLQARLAQLFPGEDIEVSVSDGAVVLSGHVSSTTVMLRAAEIAEASTPDHKIVNLLQLPGGEQSQQVLLQVRFAEVSHSVVDQLAANIFTTRTGFQSRSSTEQDQPPTLQPNVGAPATATFSDLLNLFFFQGNQGIGATVAALKTLGDIESLAEPNLLAYNGQEASFLAGGEIPVPVVSGATGTVSVTYKEFGVRLRFKPTIAGDMIRLHVRPEVSTLDFANGVTISGFRIPALDERWAETDVELRDGQSFAIAGLLQSTANATNEAVPILSQIPIVGAIFKSMNKQKTKDELLVLITPRLVRPLNPDEVPPLPTMPMINKGIGGGNDAAGKLKGGGGLLDAPSAAPAPASGTAASPAAASAASGSAQPSSKAPASATSGSGTSGSGGSGSTAPGSGTSGAGASGSTAPASVTPLSGARGGDVSSKLNGGGGLIDAPLPAYARQSSPGLTLTIPATPVPAASVPVLPPPAASSGTSSTSGGSKSSSSSAPAAVWPGGPGEVPAPGQPGARSR